MLGWDDAGRNSYTMLLLSIKRREREKKAPLLCVKKQRPKTVISYIRLLVQTLKNQHKKNKTGKYVLHIEFHRNEPIPKVGFYKILDRIFIADDKQQPSNEEKKWDAQTKMHCFDATNIHWMGWKGVEIAQYIKNFCRFVRFLLIFCLQPRWFFSSFFSLLFSWFSCILALQKKIKNSRRGYEPMSTL